MEYKNEMASLGYKIIKDFDRPDKDIVEGFADFSSTAISDVIGKLFTMSNEIKPLYKPIKKVVGTAFTVRMPPGDNLMTHAALNYIKDGDVMVADARGDKEYCLGGALMCAIAQRRGVRGFILDGTYRDEDELRSIDFPVYAKGLQAKPPQKKGPGEMNSFIYCGGVPVKPGDIIVADNDGIVVIPSEYSKVVLEAVKTRAKKDEDRWADIAGWDRDHSASFNKILVDTKFTIEE